MVKNIKKGLDEHDDPAAVGPGLISPKALHHSYEAFYANFTGTSSLGCADHGT